MTTARRTALRATCRATRSVTSTCVCNALTAPLDTSLARRMAKDNASAAKDALSIQITLDVIPAHFRFAKSVFMR